MKYSQADTNNWINEQKKQQNDLMDSAVQNFIKALDNDTEMVAWMEFTKRFYNYSLRNQMLIFLQDKNSTQVAGKVAWGKKFDRKVVDYKKRISIFAPQFFKVKEINDKGIEVEVEKLKYYRTVQVYDVANTEGKALPERPEDKPEVIRSLIGACKFSEVIERLENAIKKEGINLNYESKSSMGTKSGACNMVKKEIRIIGELEPIKKISVLIHEYAHYLLHSKNKAKEVENMDATYSEGELEAEGVAYVTGRMFGIVNESSARYVQIWGHGSASFISRVNRIIGCSMLILKKTEEVE